MYYVFCFLYFLSYPVTSSYLRVADDRKEKLPLIINESCSLCHFNSMSLHLCFTLERNTVNTFYILQGNIDINVVYWQSIVNASAPKPINELKPC